MPTRAIRREAEAQGWVASEGRWLARPLLASWVSIAAALITPLGLVVAALLAIPDWRPVRLLAGLGVVGAALIARRFLSTWSGLLRMGMNFPIVAPVRPAEAWLAAFGSPSQASATGGPAEAAKGLLRSALVADRRLYRGHLLRSGGLADAMAASLGWSNTDRSGLWWAALARDPEGGGASRSRQSLAGSLEKLAPWLGEWHRAIVESDTMWS